MTEQHWHLVALFLLTFLSEDAAVLAGGVTAAECPGGNAWISVYLACFLGIWAGDLGLYLAASRFGTPLVDRFWGKNPAVASRILRSKEWFQHYGVWAFLLCRVVPGMRLPTYLTAGLLGMPAAFFTVVTGVLAAVWVEVIFLLVSRAGRNAPELIHRLREHIGWVVLLAVMMLTMIRLLPRIIRLLRDPKGMIRRMHWEFWPAWLFYLPVALNYLRLALIHRGITLPTCANPGMFTGGLIGESKFATLRELQETNPGYVAKTALLESGEDRLTHLAIIMETAGLTYPIVLKPDVGQRGSGFRVIRSNDEASEYLSSNTLPVVIQRYIPGPYEAGVFYYRRPGEDRGRILAITEKVFPCINGNGHSTLRELILGDPRASVISETYLRRFSSELGRVPVKGESIRLVEAGNHAQGCIFRDGWRLWSKELEERIDAISFGISGFFIGRYDLRYSDPSEFRKGQAFSILELNGSSAEATSAYDADAGLLRAYRILFRQWKLVFEIGAANRKLGCRPDSIRLILKAWNDYRIQSRSHPPAD